MSAAARVSRKVGLLLALLLLWACAAANEPYSRIHDAALSGDGTRIVLLVERGDSELTGSTFSATWHYRPRQLAVWHLQRASGRLALARALPVPTGFDGGSEPPRLAQWSPADVTGGRLPVCDIALGACAVSHAPQPFLSRDIAAGIDVGLQLIDGASGLRVHVVGGQTVSEPWPWRTAAALAAAADSAMTDALHKLLAAARRQLAQSMADTGAYPHERGATIIDSAISAGYPGLRTQYYIDAGGVVTAQVAAGDGPSIRLRWIPSVARADDGLPQSFQCEADSQQASRWLPSCVVSVASVPLDPELVYVMSRSAELKASAARDAVFQSARRGVTFGVRRNDIASGQVWLGCVGLPASRVGGCDLEQGDTPCDLQLPLLCVQPSAAPQGHQEKTRGPDGAWSAAVAASAPVKAETLATIAAADTLCVAQFGPGWRLLRTTDHGDGFIAAGHIEARSRLWVDVPDQPARNCWTR